MTNRFTENTPGVSEEAAVFLMTDSSDDDDDHEAFALSRFAHFLK